MPRVSTVSILVVAFGMALAGITGILAVTGHQPGVILSAMFGGAFGSAFGLSETLLRTIPVLLCALAAAIPAQTGQINIGGEGQLYLGAIGAVLGAAVMADWSSPFMVFSMCIAGLLAGGAWSAIPGALRATMGVNEALTSLFLNYVALHILQFLVHGPLRDPSGQGWPMSPFLPEAAHLGTLGSGRLHWGIGAAAGLALILVMALYATRVGTELRAVGLNRHGAALVGIPVRWYLFGSFILGGALAGLAGYFEVAGVQHRLRPDLSPGFGYSGFLVAWMCREQLWLIIPLSVLVAAFLTGAENIQIAVGLPPATADILQGLFLLFILLGQQAFARAEQRRATRSMIEGTHE